MKLGLISDIHANLPALDAVLSDMPPVDTLVCLGDIVGYNPYPSEAVEIVRDTCTSIVQGNHDRLISDPPFASNHAATAGLHHAQTELSSEQIRFLEHLPTKIEVCDGRFLIVHSHPDQLDKYIMPHHFDEMEPYLDQYDGVFMGHTHYQKTKRFDTGLVLNPGSVGQPRDEPTAAYAIIDTDSLEVDLCRTNYDIYEVTEKINEVGLPQTTAEKLTPTNQRHHQHRNSRY